MEEKWGLFQELEFGECTELQEDWRRLGVVIEIRRVLLFLNYPVHPMSIDSLQDVVFPSLPLSTTRQRNQQWILRTRVELEVSHA